ncbi:MAG: PD-(D/E)XK nuclease family protein [Myxococcota bacterium]
MNTIYLSPETDVISHLLDNIDLNNLKRYLFVFPGNRPRMYLFKAIAEKINRPFEPPAVFSFEDFMGFILEKSNLKPDIATEIELLGILYNLKVDNDLYKKYRQHLSLFLPFAQKIFLDYSLIVKGGKIKGLNKIRDNFINEYRGKEICGTVTQYIDIIIALDKELGMKKKAISSEIFNLISDINADRLSDLLAQYEKVFLVNIIPLFEKEGIFIKNISKLNNAYLIYQKSPYLTNFRVLREIINLEDAKINFHNKEVWIYESPDIHAQVIKLKGLLKKRYDAPDTLLMLPDSSTLRVVNNLILNELGPESFNVSMGISLSGMEMSEFFNLLFDMIAESVYDLKEVKTAKFYKFINHRYIQSLDREIMKISNDIGKKNENRVSEYIDVDNLKEDYKSSKIFINILMEVFEKGKNIKTIGSFSEYICNLITFISEHQKGALNYGYFHIEAAKVLERFRGLSESAIKDVTIRSSEYKSVFNNFISNLIITPSGSPLKGLQVLGIYESRAIRFKDVFILDFNDEIFFDSSFEDSFLPYSFKQRLDIPPHSEYDNYKLYFIDLLFAQSENVTVFYRVENKLTKNRYLMRYIFEQKKEEKEIKETTLYYTINLMTSEPQIIPKDKFIDRIFKQPISATALNTYLNCPAKFYYNHILKIGKKEEIDDEVDANIYGNIIHSTLKRYFEDYKNKNSPEKIDKDKIFKILDKEFNNRIIFKSDTLCIHRAILELIVENFIKIYQSDSNLFKSKIIELEEEHIVVVKINNKKLQLKGRFDRLDLKSENGGSAFYIIDYKLAKKDNYKIASAKPNDFDKNNIKDFILRRENYVKKYNNIQLPFYIYLAKNDEKINKKAKDFTASFIFLRELDIDNAIKSIPENSKSTSEYTSIVEFLLEELINPDVPFFPLESKGCDYCEFYSTCYKNQ